LLNGIIGIQEVNSQENWTSLDDVVVYQISNPDFSNALENGIGNGYCVDLVRYYKDVPFKGDAKYWYGQAVKLGFEVGNEPKENAIYTSLSGEHGHVALVTYVGKDNFTLLEQNVKGRYVISKRSLPLNMNYLFIY